MQPVQRAQKTEQNHCILRSTNLLSSGMGRRQMCLVTCKMRASFHCITKLSHLNKLCSANFFSWWMYSGGDVLVTTSLVHHINYMNMFISSYCLKCYILLKHMPRAFTQQWYTKKGKVAFFMWQCCRKKETPPIDWTHDTHAHDVIFFTISCFCSNDNDLKNLHFFKCLRFQDPQNAVVV